MNKIVIWVANVFIDAGKLVPDFDMEQRSDASESSKLREEENRNVSRAWPPESAIEGSSSTAAA